MIKEEYSNYFLVSSNITSPLGVIFLHIIFQKYLIEKCPKNVKNY